MDGWGGLLRRLVGSRGGSLAAAVVMCFVLGGAVQFHVPAAERARRQRLIANKTADERMILRAQFERWKALPDAEKDKWRQFHLDLEGDRTQLKATLNDYVNWLGSLTLTDRDSIREQTDPAKRALRVQELQSRQRQFHQGPMARAPFPKRGVDPHILAKPDFERAVRTLEQTPVVSMLLRGGPPRTTPLSRASRMIPGLGGLLAQKNEAAIAAIDKVRDTLSDATLKAELDKSPEDLQTYRTYVLLIRSLGAEFAEVLPHTTSDEGRASLEQFFFELDPKQQDELLKSRPEWFWFAVQAEYARDQNVPYLEAFATARILSQCQWDAPPARGLNPGLFQFGGFGRQGFSGRRGDQRGRPMGDGLRGEGRNEGPRNEGPRGERPPPNGQLGPRN